MHVGIILEYGAVGRNRVYLRGIPDFEKASDGPRPVMLDDLLNEAYAKDKCDNITKGSRYRTSNLTLQQLYIAERA